MKLLTRARSIFDRFLDSTAYLAAFLCGFIIVGIITEVVMRKVWLRPIDWMHEATEYSLLWIGFLVAAWVLRSEGHVNIDILLDRLKPETQALVNTIISVIGVIVFLIITWFSLQVALGYLQTDFRLPTITRPPKFPIFIIIPVGSFLLIIQFMRRTRRYFRSWRGLPDQRQESKMTL